MQDVKRPFMCALLLGAALLSGAESVHAQTLVANDDEYGVPFDQPLEVEPSGVLDNDTLDGEPAGENGATAELLSDVSHGALLLDPNGSFTYTPDSSFDGSDAFTYRAVFSTSSSEATATLTACTGGPLVFSCWKEPAYLAKAAELGYGTFQEGFEDDVAWSSARSPDTAPSVTSLGVRWETNHPDPPASNELTTSSGPARTGLWGIYDSEHGYATGTPTQCDVNDPNTHCLFHDGVTGIWEGGPSTLHGAGGFFDGMFGANLAVILDGNEANPIDFGQVPGIGHHFFGVIDAAPAGFTRFEFRETDGKIGQALFIWADDFTLATAAPEPIPAVSTRGLMVLGLLLALAAAGYFRRSAAPKPLSATPRPGPG